MILGPINYEPASVSASHPIHLSRGAGMQKARTGLLATPLFAAETFTPRVPAGRAGPEVDEGWKLGDVIGRVQRGPHFQG